MVLSASFGRGDHEARSDSNPTDWKPKCWVSTRTLRMTKDPARVYGGIRGMSASPSTIAKSSPFCTQGLGHERSLRTFFLWNLHQIPREQTPSPSTTFAPREVCRQFFQYSHRQTCERRDHRNTQ